MDVLLTRHRVALGDLDRLVDDLAADDLARPTPCGAWSVADLLGHYIGQHRGFAAAVRDGDAERGAYAPVDWTRGAWRASVAELLDAFAGADLAGTAHQVELRPDQPLPIRFLVAASLLDSAVHAWDLATALGRSYRPDPGVVDAVLAVAERIPDGPNRDDDGAAFSPALSPRTGDDDWLRALRLVGRDPHLSAAPAD